MPRKSPYALSLDDSRMARTTSRGPANIRCRIETSSGPRSCLLAAEGLDNDEIAARLDTRREIVSKWRKRFFEQGLPGLEERPRGGRPAVFSP